MSLTKALSDSSDPIFLTDKQLVFYWANSAAIELFGLNKNFSGSLAPLLGNAVCDQLRALKNLTVSEVEIKRGTMTIRQAVFAIDLSSSDPAKALTMIVCKSCSHKEILAKDRDDFLSTALHDLRNPLGAIFGYTEVLLETIADPLTTLQRSLVTRIRSTAARCVDLARNYQLLLQLDSAFCHSSLTAKSNLNQVIEAVVQSAWREQQGLASLKLELSQEILDVKIERFQLDRIVANLLGNALKYTPATESIQLTTRSVDGFAELCVMNSAPAIPSSEIPKLFERYTRGSTARDLPGNGLGLYIVKRILDQIGGTIRLESSHLHGTVVTALLPLTNCPAL